MHMAMLPILLRIKVERQEINLKVKENIQQRERESYQTMKRASFYTENFGLTNIAD